MPRLSHRDLAEHLLDLEEPPEVIVPCTACGGQGIFIEEAAGCPV